MNVKMVIAVRKDLNMPKGKIGAQCGHAAKAFIDARSEWSPPTGDGGYLVTQKYNAREAAWQQGIQKKVVVGVANEQELMELVDRCRLAGITTHTITDAGLTMFDGEPTLTCAAFGPDRDEVLDPFTKGLKLL
jgi:PTH2 family peptidyl-tRNA hydrolase